VQVVGKLLLSCITSKRNSWNSDKKKKKRK